MFEPLPLAGLDLYVVYLCQGRALAAPGQEHGQRHLIALRFDVHAAIGLVADKAFYTQGVRLLFGRGPEKHTLHLAGYFDRKMLDHYFFTFIES